MPDVEEHENEQEKGQSMRISSCDDINGLKLIEKTERTNSAMIVENSTKTSLKKGQAILVASPR